MFVCVCLEAVQDRVGVDVSITAFVFLFIHGPVCCSVMAFSEAQQTTMVQASNRGVRFLPDHGRPCECGEDADVSTSINRRYSDTVTYHHTCGTCGAQWATWTEG